MSKNFTSAQIAVGVLSASLVFGTVVYCDQHKNDRVSEKDGFTLTDKGKVIVPTGRPFLKNVYNFESETVSSSLLGIGKKIKAEELSYSQFLIYKRIQKDACEFAAGNDGYDNVCFELRSSIDFTYDPY